MPTSVPGLTDAAAARHQSGFSLLEVLIVLAIVGIMTGIAGLSLRAVETSRKLDEDARRLARLFELAQSEARKTGRPVRWEYGAEGYRFSQTSRQLMLPVALVERMALHVGNPQLNGALRPRAWSTPQNVEVKVFPPNSNVFEGEWVSGPHRVELDDGLHAVRLQRTGTGQYVVVP